MASQHRRPYSSHLYYCYAKFHWHIINDFRLSRRFIVNVHSDIKSLHRKDVGNIADVSEVYDASTFSGRTRWMFVRRFFGPIDPWGWGGGSCLVRADSGQAKLPTQKLAPPPPQLASILDIEAACAHTHTVRRPRTESTNDPIYERRP
jgi:hypothetical protein